LRRILTVALTNSPPDKALANEATVAVAEANEAIKANALVRTVKTVRIVSRLASRQKKNSIVTKITSVLTVESPVTRATSAVASSTRTVYRLDALITTRPRPSRFETNSRIEAKSDRTPDPNPYTPLSTTTISTTMCIPPMTLVESQTEPPSVQKTTRAPRQHRSRPGAFFSF
jgi:hypothetical protein